MNGPGPQMQPPPAKRPHGPRLYHKKSKTGCYRCKGRRVKCDEKRPVCGGCSRHMVECVYPAATAAPTDDSARQQRPRGASFRSGQQQRPQQHGASDHPPPGASASGASQYGSAAAGQRHDSSQHHQSHRRAVSSRNDDDDDIAPPESRERRLTEMHLLYHYLMTQARTFRRPFNVASMHTTTSPAASTGTAASSPGTITTPNTANPFASSPLNPQHPQKQQQPHHPHPQPSPSQQLPSSDTFVWSVETIEMAFESDAILYILLAHSALSAWVQAVDALPPHEAERGAGYGYENVSDPDCHRWRRVQRQYVAMALREQRRAVAGLGREEDTATASTTTEAGAGVAAMFSPTAKPSPSRADHLPSPHQPPPPPPIPQKPPSSRADYVCMSSLMILSHAFALVQTVPTKPSWQPPLEWLQMGHGAGHVLAVAKGMLSLGRDRMARFLNTPPRFDQDEMFAEHNRAGLMWLLERPTAAEAAAAAAGPRRRRGGKDPEEDGRQYSPSDAAATTTTAFIKPDPAGRVSPEGMAMLPRIDEDVIMGGSDPGPEGHHQNNNSTTTTAADDDYEYDNNPDPWDSNNNNNNNNNPNPSSPSHSSHPPSDDDDDADADDDDLADPATRRVYERVLAYTGWTERAARAHAELGDAGEPLFGVCRRFAAFAVWTPEAFHDLLRRRRPRALVVLAYFFALLIPFRGVWMIGKAGPDQVRAIRGALPPRWRARLDPLAARYGIAWDE